jgi:hypothetical protein
MGMRAEHRLDGFVRRMGMNDLVPGLKVDDGHVGAGDLLQEMRQFQNTRRPLCAYVEYTIHGARAVDRIG